MEAPSYHLPQQQLPPGPYYGSIPYQEGYFYTPQHQQPQQWRPLMGYPMISRQWPTQQLQPGMPQVEIEDCPQPPLM